MSNDLFIAGDISILCKYGCQVSNSLSIAFSVTEFHRRTDLMAMFTACFYAIENYVSLADY